MNHDNNCDDKEKAPDVSSVLKQEERTDRTLLGEFGLAALASLFAFFSAVLTTVVEGHSDWRPFWLTLCITSVLCAIGLLVQGARNFSKRP
jgi:pheromone shutdown protein TraB